MKKELMFLITIILLGVILRFYRLGDFPVGFHRDEAFLGYNAYAILKTGKDMTGNFLPLHIESFLFSPAGYSYASLPFILLFDLQPFSVRFASAFFGSASIVVIFFLTLILFEENKFKKIIAFTSAFFFAITPWHINLSRTATENTVAVFFILCGLYFFLKSLKQHEIKPVFFSYVCFSISLFIYQAPRAFLPLFIPFLFILFRKEILKKKNYLRTHFLLYFLMILLPLAVVFSSHDLSLRIRTVSIFASEETKLVLEEQINRDGEVRKTEFTRLFHNKIIGYGSQFLDNYFKHISYSFLFTDQGFPERYKVPLIGLLYIFQLLFFLLGLWYLFRKEEKVMLFLSGWILLSVVGSALTHDDVPNLQRTLLMFPAFIVVIAAGVLYVFSHIRNKRFLFPAVSFIMTSIFFFSFFQYVHQYYIHAPVYRSWYRNDGYKELVAQVNQSLEAYKHAVITDRESSPTIFFLFYSKYNPQQFQREIVHSTMKDFDRINFGKYTFSQEECPLQLKMSDSGKEFITGEKNIIYVNSGLCKTAAGAIEISTIKRADNSTAFRIFHL